MIGLVRGHIWTCLDVLGQMLSYMLHDVAHSSLWASGLVHSHRPRRYVLCFKNCDEHVKQLLYLIKPPDRGAVFLMAEMEQPEDHFK